MEAVTHLLNDTVEFYKWGLTIAGKIFIITCSWSCCCHCRVRFHSHRGQKTAQFD